MGNIIITPRLFYHTEAITVKGKKVPVPISRQYVVWILYQYDIKAKREVPKRIGLAKTDDTGVMYSCASNINFDGKKFFASTVTDPLFLKKYYAHKYLPVTFMERQRVAMFIWPYPSILSKEVYLKDLQSKGLIIEGRVLQASRKIELRCPIDIYIERIQHYTGIIKRATKPYQEHLNGALACGALVDQAYNLVQARGMHRQQFTALKAHQNKMHITAGAIFHGNNIESEILSFEIFNEMRKNLQNYIKLETRKYNYRAGRAIRIMVSIFRSDVHNWQYSHTNWREREKSAAFEKHEKVTEIYTEAHVAMLKTGAKVVRKLVEDKYAPIIKKAARGKGPAARALEETAKTAAWFRDMTDGVLKIVAGARIYRMSKELTSLRSDLLGACRYLEARGVLQKVDDLEETLDGLIDNVSRARRQKGRILIDATPYYDATAPLSKGAAANIKGMISSGISGIALLAALNKESKNIRDDIDKATAVYGFATSITDIPAIGNRIPKGAVISKATGVVGAAADWGISIYDMYHAADQGDGRKFAYSVVSYAGKGFIAGGTVLAMTPLAPLGAVLIAIGVIINIVGSIVEAILEFKSADEKKYDQIMEKILKDNDPSRDKWIADYYTDLLLKKKVKSCAAVKKLRADNPNNTKQIDSAYKEYNFEEFKHKFFLLEHWGFQEELLDT